MKFSVYQHWDPLKVCVVGKSYPPEFYSWIKVPRVRSLFEKIALETEEDYQNIINKLAEFGIEVYRPNIDYLQSSEGQFSPPPMCPRDNMIMIGENFYLNWNHDWKVKYDIIKGNSWPLSPPDKFENLPLFVQNEINGMFGGSRARCYDDIVEKIKSQGNAVKESPSYEINGAMVSRIGRDLYVGTFDYNADQTIIQQTSQKEFPDYRVHVVNSGGHSDGTYCPVCPGLIISLKDIPTYADTFPGWEVIYLPGQSWDKVQPFLDLKNKNQGKWWIPGFEHDQSVIDTVETWLGHWTGYVEETVFDVNMLIIDPKNVMVFNYNKQVFDALERYGITPHIVPFRHRYFWDGGIHCVTLDLHREGSMKDYFPNRT